MKFIKKLLNSLDFYLLINDDKSVRKRKSEYKIRGKNENLYRLFISRYCNDNCGSLCKYITFEYGKTHEVLIILIKKNPNMLGFF